MTAEQLQEAPSTTGTRFSRVLLKLSGEALMGDLDHGVDPARLDAIADEIVAVHARGLEIAIVIGAGNIIRGMEAAAAAITRARTRRTRRARGRPARVPS